MSEAASRLLVSIEATTEQLRRELKSADTALGKHEKTVGERLQKTRKAFNDSAARMAKWGAAAGLAAGAAGAAIVKAGLNSVDSLAKTSDKLGIATEELAKLRFAAEQTGVSSNTLDMALQRMTRRVSEAGQGTGEAVKALEELGLNAKDLAKQSPDQIFREVTRAMEGVDNQSDKVRLAFKLFDSEGVNLVNTLGAGVDGLDRFGAEAEAAGLAVSRDMAARVEGANDALNRVSKMTEGFSQQLAVKFAPAIEAAGAALFDTGTSATSMEEAAEKAFNGIIKAVGFVADAFHGLTVVFELVKTGVAVMVTEMAKGLDSLLSHAAKVASYIPGVDIDYEGSTFATFIDSLEHSTNEAVENMQKKLEEPLPSEQFAVLLEKSEAAFEEQAKVAEKSQERVAKAVASSGDVIDEVMADIGVDFSTTSTAVTQDYQSMIDSAIDYAVSIGETETAAEKASKNISESTDSMATIVNRGFERMRDGVGDFFQKMIVDGKASFDDLLDMFKAVIAEMIATAASNKIMVALGLASASSSASASGGGGSGFMDSIIGGASNLFGGGSAITSALSSFGSSLVQTGDAITSAFGMTGTSTTTAMSVGAAATAGAGIAGGMAGTAIGESLFGKEAGSAWGATAGAAFGAAIGGPLGAALGGAVGGLVDAAFGSSQSDKWVNYVVEQGAIKLIRDTGKPLSQEAAKVGVDIAQTIMDVIGETTAEFEISGGRRSGIRIDGEVFGTDVEAAAGRIFDLIVAGSTEMTEALKNTLTSFDGTTEQALYLAAGLKEVTDNGNALNTATMQMIDAFGGGADQAIQYAELLTQVANGTGGVTTEMGGMLENMTYAFPELAGHILNVTNNGETLSQSLLDMAFQFEGTLEQQAAFVTSLGSLSESGGLANDTLVSLIRQFDGTAEQTVVFAQVMAELDARGRAADATFLQLISAFEGTADETIAYALALDGLSVALDVNPVDSARESYAAAGVTLSESYINQVAKIGDLVASYDGSLAATQDMSSALGVSQEMAYALATQLMQASDAIEALTTSSAEQIRQSIMSESELREARTRERDALIAELETLSDPDAIKGTVAEIERLNKQVFDSLGPEAQRAQAESFAGLIESVNIAAQSQLETAIAEIESTQAGINATIGDALDNAAANMQSAANTMLQAAQTPIAVEVKIPGHARGGLAKPGLAIVGEEGPELVSFNRPGFVHTASQTRRILSGTNGGDDVKAELQSLAVMMSRQLKLWQRVTRNGETLRTTAA